MEGKNIVCLKGWGEKVHKHDFEQSFSWGTKYCVKNCVDERGSKDWMLMCIIGEHWFVCMIGKQILYARLGNKSIIITGLTLLATDLLWMWYTDVLDFGFTLVPSADTGIQGDNG